MYSIGDKIVYPMHGAGVIDRIEEKTILGEDRQYYVLQVSSNDMKVMIPVDKCEEVGIRNIIEEDEVDGVMKVLSGPSTEMSDNWNRRNRENMEHLRTGDIKEVAGVVRNMLRIERSKPLSTGEKKMLTNARQILTSELVLVLGRAESDVQDMIEQAV